MGFEAKIKTVEFSNHSFPQAVVGPFLKKTFIR